MQKKVDKRFGELAIEEGIINEEQLNTMLTTQKQGHLLLGQALIDRNYFTLEQLETALGNYKKQSGMSTRQFNVIKNDDEQEIGQVFKNFGENVLSDIYSCYVTLLIKNIIRFIDDNPTIEIKPRNSDYRSDWFVYQDISGEINLRTGIACETEIFIKLASLFAQEQLTEADEPAQDSVGEFLNLHNGIFIVNMSNNDIELEIKPQTVTKGTTQKNTGKGYIVSCHMIWGDFDLLIG